MEKEFKNYLEKEELKKAFMLALQIGSDFTETLLYFHRKKFPNVDSETQYRKLLGEVHEFELAISEEEKIDEACDIIISALGYLDRISDAKTEIYNKFCKVLERPYPDNFQHKEE